jgi:hypothetical protein
MLRFVSQDVEDAGYRRTRFLRPLKDDFQGDVTYGAGVLGGVALGALAFDPGP